jgi:predicted DsbA family dithiol-disulfide isomerase
VQPIRLIAYSDYLCPWCYNASVRLRRVEDEMDGALEVVFKSFLLRPEPNERRSLEKFRAYTESWLRPAAEPDAGEFRVWQGDAGPPSHSVPPHLVAKAAAAIDRPAFRRMHERLLHAYFAENRDISAGDTLVELWSEAGLPPGEFSRVGDPAHLQAVIEEHHEAVRLGVNGVPAARMEDNDVCVTGAFPIETLRRWVQRTIAARQSAPS